MPKLTPEIADEICAEIAQGKSLNSLIGAPSVGKRREGWPSMVQWYSCIATDTELLNKYTRAKEQSAEVMAEEILEIADENPGTLVTGGKDAAAVNHQRLRVDARKWIAAKLKPKKYGDHQQIEHSGSIDLGLADRLAKAAARADLPLTGSTDSPENHA